MKIYQNLPLQAESLQLLKDKELKFAKAVAWLSISNFQIVITILLRIKNDIEFYLQILFQKKWILSLFFSFNN